jgi:NAD(P)-dependent dehydrogenase (short-subunit alcohol dehydrogenase family)
MRSWLMVPGLRDKVAVVTGATQTMGETIARRLAADGAHVVGFGRSAERGRAVAARLTAEGGSATFVEGDITNDDDVRALVDQTVESFGRLDIVVNNAAAVELIRTGVETGVVDEPAAAFEWQFRVGLFGPLRLAQLAIPHMVRGGGGAFVTISSQGGHRAFPGMTSYGPVKAAAEALSRQIAVDYGDRNIRSNCVVVGSIRVEQNERVHDDPALGAQLRDMQMLPIPGSPEHIASAVAFLAGDDAEFISGVALPVDGGLMAKAPMSKTGFSDWMDHLSTGHQSATTT